MKAWKKGAIILCAILLVLISSGCAEVSKITTQPAPTTTSAHIITAPPTTTPATTTVAPTMTQTPTTAQPIIEPSVCVSNYCVNDSNVIIILSKQKYQIGEEIKAEFIPKKLELKLFTLMRSQGFHDPYVDIYHFENNIWGKLDINGYYPPPISCENGKLKYRPVISLPPLSTESFDKKIDFKWNQEYKIETLTSCEGERATELITKKAPSGRYKLMFSYSKDEFLESITYEDIKIEKISREEFPEIKRRIITKSYYYYEMLRLVERSVEVEFEIE